MSKENMLEVTVGISPEKDLADFEDWIGRSILKKDSLYLYSELADMGLFDGINPRWIKFSISNFEHELKEGAEFFIDGVLSPERIVFVAFDGREYKIFIPVKKEN